MEIINDDRKHELYRILKNLYYIAEKTDVDEYKKLRMVYFKLMVDIFNRDFKHGDEGFEWDRALNDLDPIITFKSVFDAKKIDEREYKRQKKECLATALKRIENLKNIYNMLINKYKPKKLNEIHGQNIPLEELKSSVLKKQPVLIYGKVGIGKTASVHALAKELNYEILEVNASDLRNKEQIQKVVINNIRQGSLFGRDKLILIDEVDGINSEDRGGLTELLNELEDSNYPIVITANDPWGSKFNLLRKKCKLIEFSTLDAITIIKILKEIIKKEKLSLDDSLLRQIAIKSKGDVRAAINDLDLILLDNIIDLDEREKEESIFNVLRTIFKTKDLDSLRKIFDNSKEDLNEIFLWIDENLAKDYSEEELSKAYYYLSKADIFRKRINKQQYWRFMYYQNLLMSLGVALSKNYPSSKFTNYTRTQRILKIWINNQKNAKKKDFVKELALDLHLSPKKLNQELKYMNFVKI